MTPIDTEKSVMIAKVYQDSENLELSQEVLSSLIRGMNNPNPKVQKYVMETVRSNQKNIAFNEEILSTIEKVIMSTHLFLESSNNMGLSAFSNSCIVLSNYLIDKKYDLNEKTIECLGDFFDSKHSNHYEKKTVALAFGSKNLYHEISKYPQVINYLEELAINFPVKRNICMNALFNIAEHHEFPKEKVQKFIDLIPESHKTFPLCMCNLIPGIAVGFWEPVRLIEITRTPYCMVNLGGLSLGSDNRKVSL